MTHRNPLSSCKSAARYAASFSLQTFLHCSTESTHVIQRWSSSSANGVCFGIPPFWLTILLASEDPPIEHTVYTAHKLHPVRVAARACTTHRCRALDQRCHPQASSCRHMHAMQNLCRIPRSGAVGRHRLVTASTSSTLRSLHAGLYASVTEVAGTSNNINTSRLAKPAPTVLGWSGALSVFAASTLAAAVWLVR